VFKGVHGCDYVSSATHQAHILTGTKSFLGLNRRVFAVIAVGQMSGLRLVGKALIGKQASSGWTATETMAVG
jgi:hypothetical protein